MCWCYFGYQAETTQSSSESIVRNGQLPEPSQPVQSPQRTCQGHRRIEKSDSVLQERHYNYERECDQCRGIDRPDPRNRE